MPDDRALAIRDEVGFYQALKAVLAKRVEEGQKQPDELDFAIRQIVSRAVAADEVVDIFRGGAEEARHFHSLGHLPCRGAGPHRNLAAETLRKLLEEEIRTRRQTNVVQARRLEMLGRPSTSCGTGPSRQQPSSS